MQPAGLHSLQPSALGSTEFTFFCFIWRFLSPSSDQAVYSKVLVVTSHAPNPKPAGGIRFISLSEYEGEYECKESFQTKRIRIRIYAQFVHE